MAAGMHAAIYVGTERKAGVLLDWQCVHVPADQEGFLPLSRDGGDTAVANLLRLIAHLRQLLPDVGGCFGQMQAELRVLVEVAAVVYNFRVELLRSFKQLFHF